MSHHQHSGSGGYPRNDGPSQPPNAQHQPYQQHGNQPAPQPYGQSNPQQGPGRPQQYPPQQDHPQQYHQQYQQQSYGPPQQYAQQHPQQVYGQVQQYPHQQQPQQGQTQPQLYQAPTAHPYDWQTTGPDGNAQPPPRTHEPPSVDVNTTPFQRNIAHSPAPGVGASTLPVGMQHRLSSPYGGPALPHYGTYTPSQGPAQGPHDSAPFPGATPNAGATPIAPPSKASALPTPATIGYVAGLMSPRDLQVEADRLWKSMNGLGTDEETVIRVLTALNPLEIKKLGRTYKDKYGHFKKRNMIEELHKETSMNFQKAILAVARGPLAQDVYLLHKFIQDAISPESLLLRDEVLMGRSNADILAIKREYNIVHGVDLKEALGKRLSKSQPRCKELFDRVLSASRSEDPVHPHDLSVTEATRNLMTFDSDAFYALLSKSDEQIRAISLQYHWQTGGDLLTLLDLNFSKVPSRPDSINVPPTLAPLKLHVSRALNRATSDATQLVHAKTGLNFDYKVLTNVIVRCHWDRSHMDAVRASFREHNNMTLTEWLCNEVSGDDFRSTLLSCVTGRFVGKRDKVVD